MSKGKLWIDCVAGSELRDTQGEILNVEGADISDLEAGMGRWNDNHGKGFFNSLGRITEAKKIFKAEDCENDRQKYYWEKIKAPYIYTKGYLYSDEEHQNAKAAAAIIRNINKTDAPLKMKASVEGGVVSRGLKDSKLLARTKIHSVALTFTPANNATLVEPLNLNKGQYNEEADYELMKSVMHLAEKNVPSFRHITRTATANKIINNLESIEQLAKQAGIEIDIKKSTADQLVEKAVRDKIRNNIEIIHKAARKLKGTSYVPESSQNPGKVFEVGENIGNLNPGHRDAIKIQPQPEMSERKREKKMPSDEWQGMKTGIKHGADHNYIDPKGITGSAPDTTPVPIKSLKPSIDWGSHADRHADDPNYMNETLKVLASKGASKKVQEHFVTNLGKEIARRKASSSSVEKSDDLEKGVKSTAKNLVLAAALATGASHIGDKNKDNPTKSLPVVHVHPISGKVYRDNKYKNEIKDMDEYKKGLKKALSAGYGGGGAPTGQVHGGVFQSESVEDGRSNSTFDYVTCDKCGNEQIKAKHQVKCRKCGKNFSLAKVFDMINNK